MSKKIDFNAFDSVCKSNVTIKNSNGKKQNVYNEETFLHFAKEQFPNFFEGNNIILSKREKLFSSTRKKIRIILFNLLESIERASKKDNKNLLKDAVKNFTIFYTAMYQINDFSVSSVSSANMSQDNRDYIAKILPIAQKVLQKEEKEEKAKPQTEKENKA